MQASDLASVDDEPPVMSLVLWEEGFKLWRTWKMYLGAPKINGFSLSIPQI